MDAAVQDCRKQAAEAELNGELARAQTVNVDAIVKNPDAYKGTVFVLIVEITQYDAAGRELVHGQLEAAVAG